MENKKLLSKTAGSLIILLLSIFIYSQIVSRILFTSVDFDEGYNLQISYNLSRNFLNYATFDGLFDSNITTGPALLIPTSFFINHASHLLPRVIMLIFTIIFIFVCHVYMYTGRLQKILFLILITLTPLFYFFSSHVLGEIPGFTFFLISLITLSKKKYFFSGFFIMLSIFTKQVYIFGILSVLLEFLLIHIFFKSQRVSVWKNAALLIIGTLTVIIIWHMYILTAVGFSYQQFANVITENMKTANTLTQPKLSLIDKRIDMLSYVFGMHGLAFVILIFTICRVIIKKLRYNFIAVSLSFFSIFYTLYFLFLGATNWYRHFFPVTLSLIVIVPLFIDNLFYEKKRAHFLFLGIVGLFILASIFSHLTHLSTIEEKRNFEQNLIFHHEQIFPFLFMDSLLAAQIQTSEYLKKLPSNSVISGISWWNVPEISYLSNREIKRDPFQKNTDYLIMHYYGEILGNTDYEYLKLIENKKEIYKSEGYKIYKINN